MWFLPTTWTTWPQPQIKLMVLSAQVVLATPLDLASCSCLLWSTEEEAGFLPSQWLDWWFHVVPAYHLDHLTTTTNKIDGTFSSSASSNHWAWMAVVAYCEVLRKRLGWKYHQYYLWLWSSGPSGRQEPHKTTNPTTDLVGSHPLPQYFVVSHYSGPSSVVARTTWAENTINFICGCGQVVQVVGRNHKKPPIQPLTW